MASILFLEDDSDYQTVVASVLQNGGHVVECVQTVTSAYQKISEHSYDLVITDLKLDGINGFQFIEFLKSLNTSAKIIVLTSSSVPSDEIKGLDLGVSDYINKSVSFMVLLKRIEWLLNQGETNSVKDTILRSEKENLELNLGERMIYIDGDAIKLSYIEFEILAYFLQNKNLAVSRADFIKIIWNEESHLEFIDERNVDTHIKNIRSKTGIRSIHSVRSVGYKWIE